MKPADHVPFADLRRQHHGIMEELTAAFARVVDSSGFILGEEVERFEEDFAAYCGARHCVGVASGTAALSLLMIAAGIKPGYEVIVPAHTFIASALGVLHAGAVPVVCDVDDGTGLIDARSAQSVVTDRTAAILPVHLYGQLCDMDAIGQLAERHGLAVFEDAAQAHGAASGGRRAGSLGKAAAFSFYPGKNIGALGDGGAIVTDDDELAGRARELRNLGQRAKGDHVVAGFNERLDGLQAAFLRVKLARLDGWNEARRRHATHYRRALGSSARLLEDNGSCVYHLFPVRVADRDLLAARLRAEGVETGIHYSPALHGHAALAGRLRRAGALEQAERWAAEELSLPMFPELEREQIERIAAICVDLIE